jgi:hypothetical protein
MTPEQKAEITKISKEFAKPFEDTVGPIHGSGWLIVDPLSGYLNACGFTHEVSQLEAITQHPQVLVLEFPDGSRFIPAGLDLIKLDKRVSNWMWM